ncbi:MAG: DUF4430 domain-containing protein [Oscillospiraceae bacterium]|nr:DUF4430 domain-containing protein [Oscillospiraceae bacterium]
MKRKLIYFIAFLVILGAVIGPALYMQKVFSFDQQNKQVESTGINKGEQGSAAELDQPVAAAKQGDQAPAQQAVAPNGISREDAAAAPDSASRENTTVQMTDDAATTVPPESGCMVWIAVVGKNGEQLFQAGQVLVKKDNKWGITALGALDASGVTYVTSPTWPDFVYSISGQANSGVSGWMYSVNGDVPMHMADKHPVKSGDRVIWWYSNSMEQPQPLWDDLIKKQ